MRESVGCFNIYPPDWASVGLTKPVYLSVLCRVPGGGPPPSCSGETGSSLSSNLYLDTQLSALSQQSPCYRRF